MCEKVTREEVKKQVLEIYLTVDGSPCETYLERLTVEVHKSFTDNPEQGWALKELRRLHTSS